MADAAPDSASTTTPQGTTHASTVPLGRAEWLARILRQRLWNGEYPPDAWLRENALRAEFGLSNGPVREALQALVAEGLLERVPYSGIRVVTLSEREIVDLFQLRCGLLELAAELAARRGDRAARAAAPEVLERAHWTWADPSRPFTGHLMEWLVDAAGNPAFRVAWDRVASQSRRYVYEAVRRAPDKSRNVTLVERLVQAVVAGDAGAARAAVRALTRDQMRELGLDLVL